MDAIDFETAAVAAKEAEVNLLRTKCMLASVAVENQAGRWLAHLWAVSTQQVNRLALIWATFPLETILPDIPLKLYGAALDAAADDGGTPITEEAVKWLARAIEEQWSPRQLRDAADVLKGKRLSSAAFQGHDVEVTEWDVPTGAFAAVGLPLSGEMPERANVIVREVLQE